MGARSKRSARIRKAMPIVEELAALACEMNGIKWTRHDSDEGDRWLPLPISMNDREDDPRDVSNFRAAERMIDAASAHGTDVRRDAWPGGVIHTLLVRADDALALREAESIISALSECGILDEHDYDGRVWEYNHPTDNECYAEDCSCAAAQRQAEIDRHQDDLKEDGCPLHFKVALSSPLGIEYDADGDLWCDVCDNWIILRDDQKAAIACESDRVLLRADSADRESKGQLALPV